MFFRHELLLRLIDDGFRVVVACAYHDTRVKIFKDIGCEFKELKISRHGKNPLSEVLVLFQYIHMMKAVKPGVVLTYTVKPNIYASLACRLLNIQYINNITGLGVIGKKGIMQRILFALQRSALKKSTCVFFQNEANFNMYRSVEIVKSRARLIPGSGVNLDKFHAAEYPPESNTIKFIIISRLRKDKGYDELFNAIRATKSKNIEYHIVGACEDNRYVDEIKSLQSGYTVQYYGTLAQDEVMIRIAECHCLIHPSHSEGMANVILENAASARPVIATDIPGCREAVEAGSNGYLFPKGDTAALVDCIEQFRKLTWAQKKDMGIAGRRKMERDFDREIVIKAYLDEIRACMEMDPNDP